MTKTQESPLRKVAILVASLEDQYVGQVLANLPPSTALRVQELVEGLADVDPQEQEAIVAEFRNSLAAAGPAQFRTEEPNADVLFEVSPESLQAEASTYHHEYHSPQPLQSLSSADTEFIVSMLLREHPQTIALVLSKLDAARAAQVLARLPEQEQSDIMVRLGELDSIDEQTVKVIEAQVAQWIAHENQRKRRLTAGREMVERILSHAAPRDRNRLTNQLTQSDKSRFPQSGLPESSGNDAEATHLLEGRIARPRLESRNTTVARQASREPGTIPNLPKPNPTSQTRGNVEDANPFANFTSDQCNVALGKIDPRLLQSALAECEPPVVTLAMFGSSEHVLKRVLRGVTRDAANRFQQSLRDMGPVRLSDILSAQQRVLYTVHKLKD